MYFFFSLTPSGLNEGGAEYIGSIEGSGTGSASGFTLDYSSLSPSPGDLAILVVGMGYANGYSAGGFVCSAPTGYTEQLDIESRDTDCSQLKIFTKIIGTESSVSVADRTGYSDTSCTRQLILIRGVDSVNPFDVTLTSASGIDGSNIDPPAISTITKNAFALAIGHATNFDVVFTQPSELDNWTATKYDNLVTLGRDSHIVSGAAALPNIQVFNPSGHTEGTTSDAWCAATLAIRSTPPELANYQAYFGGNTSGEYLSRNNTINGTDRTKATFSCWVKVNVWGSYPGLFDAYISNNDLNYITFANNTNLYIHLKNGGIGGQDYSKGGLNLPTGDWFHIVVSLDTTQAVVADRCKVWIDGVSITPLSGSVNQNAELAFGASGSEVRLADYLAGGITLDGTLYEPTFIDGQALDVSLFGYDDGGTWTPKRSHFDYGQNGFRLGFENSGNLGNDTSGNNNHFTANNMDATNQQESDLNPIPPEAGAFDLTSHSAGNTLSLASDSTLIRGLYFSDDGLHVYYCDTNNHKVFQRTLSTPFDITTAGASTFGSYASNPTGVWVSPDGTLAMITLSGINYARTFTLSTPFDITTGTWNSKQGGGYSTMHSGSFSADGTYFYYLTTNEQVHQEPLSTPFDLSTAGSRQSNTSIDDPDSIGDLWFQAMSWSRDGSKLFIGSNGNGDRIYEYSAATEWDLTTLSYTGNSYYQAQGVESIATDYTGSSLFYIGADDILRERN